MARKSEKSVRELELQLQVDLIELEMTLDDSKRAKRVRDAWPKGWTTVEDAFPTTPAKTALTLRLDADVARWFRAQGRGYQARMNAVLRAYMLTRKGKIGCNGRAEGF